MLDISAARKVAPHYRLTVDQIYDLSLDAMSDYEIKQIIKGISETLDDDEAYLDELVAERELLFNQKEEIQAEVYSLGEKSDALRKEADELDKQLRELAASGQEIVNAANDMLPVIKDIEAIGEEYRKAQDFLREYLRRKK